MYGVYIAEQKDQLSLVWIYLEYLILLRIKHVVGPFKFWKSGHLM